MADKSIKVSLDIHKEVDAYTQKTGGKIGKFYDLAAKEKLEREQERDNVILQRYGKRKETK